MPRHAIDLEALVHSCLVDQKGKCAAEIDCMTPPDWQNLALACLSPRQYLD